MEESPKHVTIDPMHSHRTDCLRSKIEWFHLHVGIPCATVRWILHLCFYYRRGKMLGLNPRLWI